MTAGCTSRARTTAALTGPTMATAASVGQSATSPGTLAMIHQERDRVSRDQPDHDSLAYRCHATANGPHYRRKSNGWGGEPDAAAKQRADGSYAHYGNRYVLEGASSSSPFTVCTRDWRSHSAESRVPSAPTNSAGQSPSTCPSRPPIRAVLAVYSVRGYILVLSRPDWQKIRLDGVNGQHTLHCRLAPDVDGTAHIPAMSNWYVLADPEYPWGTITFCPANDGGLVATFQHQHHNGTGPGDRPWRAGDICLDTTVRVLDRAGDDDEPYTAHERLRWRFRRALDWLDAAARGILTLPGEPFELPEFPTVAGARTVAYAEGRDSYAVWDALPDRAGNVDLVRVREGIYAVARFHGTGGRSVFEPHWGSALSPEVDGATRGIWLRLDAVPVLAPWQAPSTWGELRAVAREQGCDIDTLLRASIRTLRDDQEHIALLGFPIPERVGETPTQLHWQALLLPPLTPARGSAMYPGFRPNEDGKGHERK